jgi:hypothetical protein
MAAVRLSAALQFLAVMSGFRHGIAAEAAG